MFLPSTYRPPARLLYKCAIETPIDDLGCKGITTFRTAGKRYGVLNAPKEEENSAEACYFDPETGQKVVNKRLHYG